MYTIGKLAKDANTNVSTIRYYLSQGLLEPVEKTQVGYMIFDESSLERLKQIITLRENDRRTIEEIKTIFKKRGLL